MSERVFVRVTGFTEVERHALNTVFRLSEQGQIAYALWTEAVPQPPPLDLIDGDSEEGQMLAQLPYDPQIKRLWVGAHPPEDIWRSFQRPIVWPEVLGALDEIFGPADPLDFDLGGFGEDPDTVLADDPPAKRVLIVAADPGQRLYLRARLALADLTQADEVETGAQALTQAKTQPYAAAVVEFGLPDVDGWELLRQLKSVEPKVPRVILLKPALTWLDPIRALLAGAQGIADQPPRPDRLEAMLQRI